MALALMAALALACALKLGAAGVEEPLAVSVEDAEVMAEAEALALGAADLLDVAVLPGPREALEPPPATSDAVALTLGVGAPMLAVPKAVKEGVCVEEGVSPHPPLALGRGLRVTEAEVMAEAVELGV